MRLMPKRQVNLAILLPDKDIKLAFSLQKFANINILQEKKHISADRDNFIVDRSKNMFVLDMIGPYVACEAMLTLKKYAFDGKKQQYNMRIGNIFSLLGGFIVTNFTVTPSEKSQLMSCAITLQNVGNVEYNLGGEDAARKT